jgi:hypothetical protein
MNAGEEKTAVTVDNRRQIGGSNCCNLEGKMVQEEMGS